MKKLFCVFIFTFSLTINSYGCFGPELIVGYDKNNTIYYASSILLELYIKEKTGIEVKIIPVLENINNLIDTEKIDIIFTDKMPMKNIKLSQMSITSDKKINFLYRTKINEDLRFTTLLEALNNLAKKITEKDISQLSTKITSGKERRIIKEFLIYKGLW